MVLVRACSHIRSLLNDHLSCLFLCCAATAQLQLDRLGSKVGREYNMHRSMPSGEGCRWSQPCMYLLHSRVMPKEVLCATSANIIHRVTVLWC